jgi:pyrroline-5-carboxylate reductase
MNICFIGFGAMAKAIARGLTKEQKHNLSAAAPSLTIGTTKEGIHTHYNNAAVIKQAQVIILAVKPAQMGKVLQELAPIIPKKSLVISVAAGLTLDWFATHIKKTALVRTMPNTPASIGQGATPMLANHYVTPEQQRWAEYIFSKIGITHWVTDEKNMDSFTALSGSGPAYFFAFIEALVKAAGSLGLDADIAKKFAIQTGIGALKLAESSDLSLSELRTQVTSPGGTTEAALNVLMERLDDLIQESLGAAKARSLELGIPLSPHNAN